MRQRGARPSTDASKFSIIQESQVQFLQAPFPRDESKGVVQDCGSCKAPRPNDYSFDFLKVYQDLIAYNVVAFVMHFYSHFSIRNGYNSYLFTVISRVRNQKIVVDFRLISLIDGKYMIVGNIG